jgi:hypothetical protein
MDAKELVDRYLSEVSNETDAERRHAAIADLFDEAVRYVDQDGPVDGREAFTRRIDDLAKMMRPNSRFTLTRPVQTVDDAVLFHWRLGTPDATDALTGTDIALVKDGRILRLYAVLD